MFIKWMKVYDDDVIKEWFCNCYDVKCVFFVIVFVIVCSVLDWGFRRLLLLL